MSVRGGFLRRQSVIATLFRCALAVVFIAASAPKIAAPKDFAFAVYRYSVLPTYLVNTAALLLPWVELTAALALILSVRFRASALLILLTLLLVFTGANVLVITRGIDLSCGCFSVGGEGTRVGWFSVMRNIVLIGLVLGTWWAGSMTASVGETQFHTEENRSETQTAACHYQDCGDHTPLSRWNGRLKC